MTCASCVFTIENGLKQKSGVLSASVNLIAHSAEVLIDLSQISSESVVDLISSLGYECELTEEEVLDSGAADDQDDEDDSPSTTVAVPTHVVSKSSSSKVRLLVSISGMTCASCVFTIENGVKQKVGVLSASVNLIAHSAEIVIDSSLTTSDDVVDTISSLGYECELTEELFVEEESDSSYTPPVLSITPPPVAASQLTPTSYSTEKAKFAISFHPQGMRCQNCVKKLSDSLSFITGVVEVKVVLNSPSVLFGTAAVTTEMIENAVSELGYSIVKNSLLVVELGGGDSPSKQPRKKRMVVSFHPQGMRCQNCVQKLSNALENISGVSEAKVTLNLPSFIFCSLEVPTETVEEVVQSLGYTITADSLKSIDLEQTETDGLKSQVKQGAMVPKSADPESGHPPKLKLIAAPNARKSVPLGSGEDKSISNTSSKTANDASNTTSMASAHKQKSSAATSGKESIAKLIFKIDFTKPVTNEEVFDDGKTLDVFGIADCFRRFISDIRVSSGGIKSVIRIPKSPFIRLSYDPATIGARKILKAANQWAQEFPTMQSLSPVSRTLLCRVSNVSENDVAQSRGQDEHTLRRRQKLRLYLGAIPVVISTIMMLLPEEHHPLFLSKPFPLIPTLPTHSVMMCLLSIPSMFWLGIPIHEHAFKSFRSVFWVPRGGVRGTLGMDALVSMASILSFIYSVLSLIAWAISPPIPHHSGSPHAMTGMPSMPALPSTPPPETHGDMPMPPEFFDTPTVLIWIVLVGRYIEAHVKSKTQASVANLSAMRPSSCLRLVPNSAAVNASTGKNNASSPSPTCTHPPSSTLPCCAKRKALLKEGAFRTVPINIDLLEIGDLILVPHNAPVPADGYVVNPGESAICLLDESVVTGESRPVEKKAGDQVIAGSLCSTGGEALIMEVSVIGNGSTLGRIIAAVEAAHANKGKTQQLADEIASKFAPVVMILAAATSLTWAYLVYTGVVPNDRMSGDKDRPASYWEMSLFCLRFGIAVLSIACPCSLGLATPTAVMAATGVAAKLGILVKGGFVFESASALTHVVLDKTGTLTEGKPAVVAAAICPSLVRAVAGKVGAVSLRGSAWGGIKEGDEDIEAEWRVALKKIWAKSKGLKSEFEMKKEKEMAIRQRQLNGKNSPLKLKSAAYAVKSLFSIAVGGKKLDGRKQAREVLEGGYMQQVDDSASDNDVEEGIVNPSSIASSSGSEADINTSSASVSTAFNKLSIDPTGMESIAKVRFLGEGIGMAKEITDRYRNQLLMDIETHSTGGRSKGLIGTAKTRKNSNAGSTHASPQSPTDPSIISPTAAVVKHSLSTAFNQINPHIEGQSLGLEASRASEVAQSFWWLLGSAETQSEHPLARGILNFVGNLIDMPMKTNPESFRVLKGGRGVVAVLKEPLDEKANDGREAARVQITVAPLAIAEKMWAATEFSTAADSNQLQISPHKIRGFKCNGKCGCASCGCSPSTQCGCLESAKGDDLSDGAPLSHDDLAALNAARAAQNDPYLNLVKDWSVGQQRLGATVVLIIASSPTAKGLPSSSPSTASTLTEGAILGAVALRDPLLPTSKNCVKFLTKERGLKVWMCTGDAPAAARCVAADVGIPPHHVRAEALPANKVALVKALQSGVDGVDANGTGPNSPVDATIANKVGQAKLIRAPKGSKKSGTTKLTTLESGLINGNVDDFYNQLLAANNNNNNSDSPTTPAIPDDSNKRSGSAYGTRLVGGRQVLPLLNEPLLTDVFHPSTETGVAVQSDRVVAMVGDGTNDAPALASANFGVAVGGGAHVALEAADAVLSKAELSDFCNLLILSDATVATIRRNFIWAFLFNALGVPLAAGVMFLPTGITIPPAVGGLLMACSSILVISSSLWLTRIKLENREQWANKRF